MMSSITTDAGVSVRPKENITKNVIIKNSIAIQEIHVDDLFYLEKDLEFYDKQLIVLSFDQEKETDLLRTWAKGCKVQWKNHLLEALCLIQAKRVIRKLGLDYDELEQRFLPANHYTASHIHLIVKLLYFVCDELTIQQCKMLVNYMTQKYASIRNFIYSDNGDHLEIYLMHWLWENVIDIGQTDNNEQATGLPCNLEPIIQWLKESEFDTLKDIVKNVVDQFNSKIIPKPSKLMQTVDRQTTDVEETSRNFESMRLQRYESKTAYPIRPEKAGIILIINQKSFHFDTNPAFKEFLPRRQLETRWGTERDAEALQKLFKKFGYETRIRDNRLHTEILNDIRDVINESVRFDSVIVCILSHGCKGIVYGANSVPVKIEEIEKLIISDRLIGKPKILIIQACQGEETQKAKEIDYLANDAPSNSLPVYSDFLTCISSVPGFTSIRHTQNGSWFIQTMCEKIEQFSKEKHFVDILTVVIREVLSKRGRDNQCMVPIFHSTLSLDLYFPTVTSNSQIQHMKTTENETKFVH